MNFSFKCRFCKNKNFQSLFSLGKISYTGKFPNSIKKEIPKSKIELVICNKCKLVQLKNSFNSKYLYADDYGYKTGLNQTMKSHMKNIVNLFKRKIKLNDKDFILDIASNDATLLNLYNKKLTRVGIDPIIKKYKTNYKKINFAISDFFSAQKIKKYCKSNKFKVITALSVFYDLPDPNKFLKDIRNILHKDGLFLLEHADLASILKLNMFDTICHEHLEYYSTTIINKMLVHNNLKLIDVFSNDINGGSMQYLISHNDSNYRTNSKKINKYLLIDKKLKLENVSTYKKFFKKIKKLKKELLSLIKKQIKKNKIIHGCGASTKGNVLLQFYGLTKKEISLIADRNEAKNGSFTPGTKIPIVSESESRKKRPDFYLVLPWHFKKEILKREKKIIKRGTKFIFPLPSIKVL